MGSITERVTCGLAPWTTATGLTGLAAHFLSSRGPHSGASRAMMASNLDFKGHQTLPQSVFEVDPNMLIYCNLKNISYKIMQCNILIN